MTPLLLRIIPPYLVDLFPIIFLYISLTTLPLARAEPQAQTQVQPPASPNFTFLYTAYVTVAAPLLNENTGGSGSGGGMRVVIPITGGNFSGPRLNGTISNLGADWGLLTTTTTSLSPSSNSSSPNSTTTTTFHANTRYNLVTADGVNIYIRTSGTSQADGRLFLRLVFETNGGKYGWLDGVLAVGVLRDLGGGVLRIDTWVVSF